MPDRACVCFAVMIPHFAVPWGRTRSHSAPSRPTETKELCFFFCTPPQKKKDSVCQTDTILHSQRFEHDVREDAWQQRGRPLLWETRVVNSIDSSLTCHSGFGGSGSSYWHRMENNGLSRDRRGMMVPIRGPPCAMRSAWQCFILYVLMQKRAPAWHTSTAAHRAIMP